MIEKLKRSKSLACLRSLFAMAMAICAAHCTSARKKWENFLTTSLHLPMKRTFLFRAFSGLSRTLSIPITLSVTFWTTGQKERVRGSSRLTFYSEASRACRIQ